MEALKKSHEECNKKVEDVVHEKLEEQKEELNKIWKSKVDEEKEIAREEALNQHASELQKIKEEYNSVTKRALNELEVMKDDINEHEKIFELYRNSERRANQVIQLYQSMLQLSGALERKKSFEEDLEILKKSEYISEMPALEAALSSIPQQVSQSGVPTLSQLRDQFRQISASSSQQNFFSKIWKPSSDKGNFSDPIVRVDYYLSANQLSVAIAEVELFALQTKEPQQQESLHNWLKEAKQRQTVEKSVQLMRTYSNLLIPTKLANGLKN